MPQELSSALMLAAGSLVTIMIGYIRHLVVERRRLVKENTDERKAHQKTRTRRDELAEELLAERKATLEMKGKLLDARAKYEAALRTLSSQITEKEANWKRQQEKLEGRVTTLEETDRLREQKLTALTEQYDTLFREKLTVEQERQELKKALEAAKREISSLRRQVDALKKSVEVITALRTEINHLRERLAAYDEKVETGEVEMVDASLALIPSVLDEEEKDGTETGNN